MGRASCRPEEVRLAVTSRGHGVFEGACGTVGSFGRAAEDVSDS